jgi:hypothetical protein
MAQDWFRVNSNGTLAKIKSLFRVNSNGTLAKLSAVFRVNSNGTIVKIFGGDISPSIQSRVEVSSSGGINSGSTIMNESSVVTLVSTRYHWLNADGFTYIWQKSIDNVTWSNIGTAQSTTNPPLGSSSSSITRVLSPSDFTSGSDMYFRFVSIATNSIYSTTSISASFPILISYYGTPTPAPGSPSITGSTVVGSTVSGNIGTWTNSPTSYDYRVYYTSGLSAYPLTYAGVKSVSSKFLSGFSAALVTSSAHGYKVDDTVVVSSMDSLFNGSHTITARTNNTIFFTLPTPTSWSASAAYSVGSLVSFSGDAYYASITMSAPTLFSTSSAYNVGDNAWDGFTRYRCIQALPIATAWSISSSYSVGTHVFSGTIRYICAQPISSASAWSSSTNYTAGSIVHFNGTRWQAQVNSGPGFPQGAQSPSSSNVVYWSEINVSLSNSLYWTQINASLSGTSYWENAYPYNSSYWTLQSFSNTATSGTTTAPNYYEGTVLSSTSIPIPITTFDYRQNIDLRGSTTSGSGAVLSFGVKAYNQATLSPSEYLGQAFIYGVPILSIVSITPVYTTASVPFTSSYISSYLLNLYTQPSITNVIGGATTVTYFAQNTFTSGQQVTITGINPSVYNGVRTIQSANATSFTVSANITDTYVSGGTAKVTVSGYPLPVNSNASPRSITGLSQGTTYYLEMTPSNNGSTGTTQTASFTTLIQPTISNISIASSTVAPGSASSVSVGNSGTTNVGSVSWINGSNTSSAWLSSVSGAGSGGITDPGSPFTTGTFTITSTGTANVNIRAVNKQKTVSVTWAQTNAQSYLISYDIAGAVGNPQVATGNSSASNPSVVLVSDTVARTATLRSITVYPNINQGGTGVNLVSTASATSADSSFTNTFGSGSVTFSSPPATPTITYSDVTSNGFTVSWSSSGATSYNVQIYQSISGNTVSGYPLNGTTNTSAIVTGLNPNLGYSTTITAINSAGSASNTASTTTLRLAALTPTFGSNTSISGGFTGSVTNYDANYTWGIATNSGSVSWGTIVGNVRTFTVSGLSAGASATVTVTTTRTNYFDGSAQTSGAASANVPPSGGSVSIALTSGTSGRVGATYTATVTNASGTPTPTFTYQWRRSINYSPFTTSNIGTNSSTYTSTFDDVDSAIFCIVTFTNGVNPNQTASSNQLQVSPPTITAVRATTTNNTAPYVTWTIIGFNIQSSQGTVRYGTTSSVTLISGTDPQTNTGLTRSTSTRSGTSANFYRYDNIRAFSGVGQTGRPSPSVSAIATTTVVQANTAATTTVFGTFP